MVETIYRIPGIPRIALLADLHNRPTHSILSSLTAHRPSIICFCGDMIYGNWPKDDVSPLVSQKNVLPFLADCAALASTYLSLGNHEWMLDNTDLDMIRGTGVTVLDNSFVSVKADAGPEKKELVIGGLTSGYVTDYRRFREQENSGQRYPRQKNIFGIGGIRTAARHVPETAWLKAFAATPGDIHICLSHHPEYFPLIPKEIPLVLSGHTHSGQVRYYSFRLHRWTGLWAPGQGLCPKYSNGAYEDRLIVSAGLANTTSIPRICNPCEIVFLEEL